MKKFACILVAMMMVVLSTVSLAESVPSKTNADMTEVTVVTEVEVPEGVEESMIYLVSSDLADQKTIEACENALTDLIAKSTNDLRVVEFFGEVKNSAGEVVDLVQVIGTDALKVFEFVPLFVKNYDVKYQSVTANLTFATVFAADQKVAVLVGIVTVNEDGTQSIEWIAFEGIGREDGSIDVTFDPDTLLAVQDGMAMLAVIGE